MISRFQRIDVERVDAKVLDEIRKLPGVTSVTEEGIGTRIEVDEEGATRVVLGRLVDAGATAVRTSLPSLEEVYVQLIGDRGLELSCARSSPASGSSCASSERLRTRSSR